MAFSSIRQDLKLIFGEVRTKIGDLFVDVTRTEDITIESDVTRKPAENGSIVTDLTQVKPQKLSLSVALTSDFVGETWQEKYQLLEQYWREAQPQVVTTEFKQYNNMVVESLQINRTKSNSSACFVQVNLIEIRIFQALTETVGPNVLSDIEDQTAPTTEKGLQVNQPADDDRSLLKTIIDGFGG